MIVLSTLLRRIRLFFYAKCLSVYRIMKIIMIDNGLDQKFFGDFKNPLLIPFRYFSGLFVIKFLTSRFEK